MNGREGEHGVSDAIALFTEITRGAIPFGIAFSLGQMVVDTFMRMAFGGRIEFR